MRTVRNTASALGLMLLALAAMAEMDPEWVATYDGPAGGSDAAFDIAVDATGNVYVTGGSDSTGSGQNTWDVLTIKYNPSGQEVWTARYDGPSGNRDEGHAIAVDQVGRVFVTGDSYSGSDSDFLTTGYDAGGTEQWVVRRYTTVNGDDSGRDIAIGPDGHVHCTGSLWYGYEYMIGANYYTVEYASNGGLQWDVEYHSGVSDDATAIAVDDLGRVYVTGTSDAEGSELDIVTIKYSTGGVPQWTARYAGPDWGSWDIGMDVAVDGDGNVYVTGVRQGSRDDYVTLKYRPGGATAWMAVYDGQAGGTDKDDWPYAIAVDDSGNVYVTGSSGTPGAPGNDFATVKYDSAGTEIWVRRYNASGSLDEEAFDLALDDDGNIFVTGTSGGCLATVKYDPSGGQQWVARHSGASASAIAVDGNGCAYVTGTTSSGDYVTIKYGSVATPVETSLCAVETASGAVAVRWTLGSLSGIEGLNLYRGTSPDAISRRMNDDPIAPDRPGEFEDRSVWPGTTFWYELRATLLGGGDVAVDGLVARVTTRGELTLELHPVHPNPSRGRATIEFDVPVHTRAAQLAVYNVRGQLVRLLERGSLDPGRHGAHWDGTDERGYVVPTGVYFVRLAVDGDARIEKILMLR